MSVYKMGIRCARFENSVKYLLRPSWSCKMKHKRMKETPKCHPKSVFLQDVLFVAQEVANKTQTVISGVLCLD